VCANSRLTKYPIKINLPEGGVTANLFCPFTEKLEAYTFLNIFIAQDFSTDFLPGLLHLNY